MGKGHRDNHKARKKRGPEAFAKKAERRAEPNKIKCNTCGTRTRPEKLVGGNCPICVQRFLNTPIYQV
jgi:rubrerythrin